MSSDEGRGHHWGPGKAVVGDVQVQETGWGGAWEWDGQTAGCCIVCLLGVRGHGA